MSVGFFRPRIAAAIMAAGSSSRMRGVKQLLPWKKTTLLGHVIGQLKQTDAIDIFVVLGAHNSEILKEVDTNDVTVVYNEQWSSGMGTSISRIISYIENNSLDYDGMLIATSDQPLLSIEHYNKLINSCVNKERIISSFYNDEPGVPAVFDNAYFQELKSLGEDKGAKSIIKRHLGHMICMDAPEGAIDLDTKQVYEKYYNTHGKND